jgi:hypothetical protein
MLLGVEWLFKAEKVTLPPILGVEEPEETTFEARNPHFRGKKAGFWPPEGHFSGPGHGSVGWVKMGASPILWVQK